MFENFLRKNIFINLGKNGYTYIDNIFNLNIDVKDYYLVKEFRKTNKNNEESYIIGNKAYLLYYFFHSTHFISLLNKIYGVNYFIDKKINLKSLEKSLGISNNGRGIITESYNRGDFYEFSFTKNYENPGFFIYIIDGSIELKINDSIIVLEKNSLFIFDKSSIFKITNNLDKKAFIFFGNLLNSNNTKILYECNLN